MTNGSLPSALPASNKEPLMLEHRMLAARSSAVLPFVLLNRLMVLVYDMSAGCVTHGVYSPLPRMS